MRCSNARKKRLRRGDYYVFTTFAPSLLKPKHEARCKWLIINKRNGGADRDRTVDLLNAIPCERLLPFYTVFASVYYCLRIFEQRG